MIWSATPKLWVVSFATFDSWPFYQAKSWKTQNTVFGYKKGSKIQSHKIFWSATLNLWVVSFATFASKWPEHRKPMGGGFSAVKPPPMRFEICNFQAESFGPEKKNISQKINFVYMKSKNRVITKKSIRKKDVSF